MSLQDQVIDLLKWLREQTSYYEPMALNFSFPNDFGLYLKAKINVNDRSVLYNKLHHLASSQNFSQMPKKTWEEIDELWHLLDTQMLMWLWFLDMNLPGDFGEIGKWLSDAEKLIMDRDLPTAMNEETAAIISRKLEEHKAFFANLPRIIELFEHAKASPLANQINPEQLRIMERRLNEIGPKATERRVKLKFLEHKCCLIAFLNLVEHKLKNWSGKYGYKEQTQSILEQYKNFVSKNKIFQEFNKALVDMQQVVGEYKRDGNISRNEIAEVDKFMNETEERWKRTSMQLKYCQSTLEEVIACWERLIPLEKDFVEWLEKAEKMLGAPEDDRLDFFQDIGLWQTKYSQLSDTTNYLIASCEDQIANELRDKLRQLDTRWQRVFSNTGHYMHAGDTLRARKEYKSGIEKLSSWLRHAERILAMQPFGDIEHIKQYGGELQQLSVEIDSMEELFKSISRTFQKIIQNLSRDEVDSMMDTLKKEKEALVRVRTEIPVKLHLFHQLLTQQESLESGQKEINQWLDEAENMLANHSLSGGKNKINERLHAHKTFFSRTFYFKSMLESKNKILRNLAQSVEGENKAFPSEPANKMQQLNERFDYVTKHAQEWEQKMQEAIRCWNHYNESERLVSEWLSQAEMLLSDRHVQYNEEEKRFLEGANQRWISDLVQAANDLLKSVPADEQQTITRDVEKIQSKWQDVLHKIPTHLLKMEFRTIENKFYEKLEEANKEIILEEQALSRSEDVDSILQRNMEYFSHEWHITNIERHLDSMNRLSTTYTQRNPQDTSLSEAYKQAESVRNKMSQRIDDIRRTLQQIPAKWDLYRERFSEMESWMDMVDKSLKNIVNEVNSFEEFEKERVVFQVSR